MIWFLIPPPGSWIAELVDLRTSSRKSGRDEMVYSKTYFFAAVNNLRREGSPNRAEIAGLR